MRYECERERERGRKIYVYIESGTPPGPQKYVVLSVFFDYFMLLFPLLIIYERSKFLGDALFLVC